MIKTAGEGGGRKSSKKVTFVSSRNDDDHRFQALWPVDSVHVSVGKLEEPRPWHW